MIDESYESRIGKKPNQKLKAYLIMKYLLEHADDAHAVSAETIVEYLKDTLGIYAERRSVYRDIDDINKIIFMMQSNVGIDENDFDNRMTIQEAEEILKDDESLKPIRRSALSLSILPNSLQKR